MGKPEKNEKKQTTCKYTYRLYLQIRQKPFKGGSVTQVPVPTYKTTDTSLGDALILNTQTI